MNWLFVSGGQSIEASASASVLLINIQDWFPLGLIVLITTQRAELTPWWSHCQRNTSKHPEAHTQKVVTQRNLVEREVGRGIGMGNTCKSMADSTNKQKTSALQCAGTCKQESAAHSFLASGPAMEKQASARADLEASWLGINWRNALSLKLSFYSIFFFPFTGSLKRMEAFGLHAFIRQCAKFPNHIIVSLPLSLPVTICLSLLSFSLSLSTHTHTHTHTLCIPLHYKA